MPRLPGRNHENGFKHLTKRLLELPLAEFSGNKRGDASFYA
jgi:hypothetical protein